MEVFDVVTKWEDGSTPKNAEITQNIFENQGLAHEIITRQVDLVWAKTKHGSGDEATPKYFKKFETKPADDAELSEARNQRLLKHVMLGRLLWNSMSPSFQLELLAEKDKFRRENEYEGLLLWHQIIKAVNPSTKLSVGNLKEELEGADLKDFEYNIKKFNTWFNDKRSMIIREAGTEGYSEYERCLFKTYRTARNKEFLDAINTERRNWMMGTQAKEYNHTDIQSFALKMYNNQTALREWETTERKPEENNQESKFLALLAEVKDLKHKMVNSEPKPSNTNSTGRELAEWRTENPNNEQTMMKDGHEFKWCTKDCHPCPMWCGRTVCYSKEEFKKTDKYRKRQERLARKREQNKQKEEVQKMPDFKVALSALMTPENFKIFESQYLN